MGRSRSSSPGAAALLVLGALVISGLGGEAVGAHPTPSTAKLWLATNAPAGPVRAYVTWDGTNVSTSIGDSSARSVNLASTITLRYVWSSTGLHNLSDARLQMFYFGYALSTRDVIDQNPQPANNGSFTMTWQPGTIAYLLEGTFRLTASLLGPTGDTAWTLNFYVHATAPYDLLAAIPILLVVIAIFEVYELATSGRPLAPVKSPPPRAKAPPGGAETSGETPEETS